MCSFHISAQAFLNMYFGLFVVPVFILTDSLAGKKLNLSQPSSVVSGIIYWSLRIISLPRPPTELVRLLL